MSKLRKDLAVGFALLILTISLSATIGFCQDGQYDVRFAVANFDCNTNEVFIDIQLTASSPSSEFNATNQNYRFSFNRDAVAAIDPIITNADPNPVDGSVYIVNEGVMSGFVFVEGLASFYNPHTLVGSVDTVATENIVMPAGDGYPIHYEQWVTVSRLRFTVHNPTIPLNIMFHTHDPLEFPPTFVGSKTGAGAPYEVEEGSYQNLTFNLNQACGGVLPIELSNFEGIDRGCSIDLEWQTESEVNNDYFIIERSLDGQEFEEIARLDGAGNSNSLQLYHYSDNDVNLTNYYQLIQVDFDGTSTVSERITVKSTCFESGLEDGITAIYPNPIRGGTATFQFYNGRLDQEANLIIADITGKVRSIQSISIQSGPNKLNFDPSNLESGIYTVKVIGHGWFSEAQKFIKFD